jgi:predicted nucleic acid-binding protein
MKVLVDTSVWSLAFRKQPKTEAQQRTINRLADLIRDLRAAMIGPIRQELLSGIVEDNKFNQLRQRLRVFDDEKLEIEHYELAASFSKQCRRNGIQGSHIDFLICAVGIKNHYPVFTLDKNFVRYQKILAVPLYSF